MSQSTISLKLAQTRSQELHIDSTSLTLDLSQAATAATYPVVAEHVLSTTNSKLVLDYLGEEISSVTID
jgi:aminopeptidase N